MKNRNGHKMGKENQHEERRGRDRSEMGFGFEKLSVRRALPLAFVLAMIFSTALIAVSGGRPGVPIYPTVLQCNVSPSEGNYTDTFTYYLSIIGPKTATITLEIYQPANKTWEVKDEKNQTWSYDTPKEDENHTFSITPFINMSQGGISSYRFKYDNGPVTSDHYPGPYLPPIWHGPIVKFFPITPNSSYEAFYDLGDTTAFNYKVNATSNVDRWFDITLKVYDPEEENWELKGESTLVYLKAGENKTLEWGNIKPFESLKSDNSIQNRIGTNSNFTFVYSGNKADKDFTGPKLVEAFKDPEIKPEIIRWGDNFTYSIRVIACKNMSITLQYCNKTQCNETEWINANKTEPTKYYTMPYEWKKLTWNCKATDSWEEVRFVEQDIIGGASAEMTSLEWGMGISQLSASKPRRSYPVPVIVKEEK